MKEFHIVFVPRKSHLCEKKLKELGVYGSFKDNLKEFFLDLIPLDYDLLSMENPELFRVSFFNFGYNINLFVNSIFILRMHFYIMTQLICFILPNL
jgi:hypothetical protein